MADTNTQLNPEEAYNVLVAQVHAPVFMDKLARVYGIVPKSAEEGRELLQMAGQLRNAHEQENQKQANVNSNFFTSARKDLEQTLNQNGYQSVTSDSDALVIKNAAANAVKNPLIKEAAIVFNNYMAQALQSA